MVVSAFPLAQVVLNSTTPSAGSSSTTAQGTGAANAGARLLGPAGDKSAYPGALPAGATDGSSSRSSAGAGSASATSTGSQLLDQVLKTARMMGYDAKLPDLPLDQLAPVNPLRPAILTWIKVTNSQVAPDELATQLARADALPQPLQRDVALLLLSASEATLMQGKALSRLTPAQISWIYEHPELADELARGVDTPQTRELAVLAGLVDMKTSIEASLLILEAVEATRGGLQDASAKATLADLRSPTLDHSTAQLLDALATAGSKVDDQSKVLFAAQLVAMTAHVPGPAKPPTVTFTDAVSSLLAATGQQPDASALKAALDTGSLLPSDLQLALAMPLAAEASAVNAANPARYTPQGQATALVQVLSAVAYSLPTLEKYHLYWRDAPNALRVGEWSPAAKMGWAAEHAAMLRSTHGNPVDVVRAGDLLEGIPLTDIAVPERSFTDAYVAIETAKGRTVNDSVRAVIDKAGASLDPRVRDAAARMMSGAAESGRLTNEAFAQLSPDDKAWLLQPRDTTSLFLKPDITMDEVRTLARVSLLSEKVDAGKLAAAEIVGTRATMEAKDLLSPAYGAQSEAARPLGAWSWLTRLLPWGDARAQSAACTDLNGVSAPIDNGPPYPPVVSNDCGNNVLLVLSGVGGCNDGTIALYCWNEQNEEDLVLVGPGTGTLLPQTGYRFDHSVCPPGSQNQNFPNINIQTGNPTIDQFTSNGQSCTLFWDKEPAVGAAIALLDLGGSMLYDRPVAMTSPTSPLDVSLHLDMGGSDVYADPTPLYDMKAPMFTCNGDFRATTNFCGVYGIGSSYGHPTQGAALSGGVAVLVHASGSASYDAPSLSQGYGQYGLGMLASLGVGDDTYRAKDYVQGAAGREMNLGLGILLDQGGDDVYHANTGQGYGLGGLLLDLGGKDRYTTNTEPMGLPIVHLTVLPGGALTTLNVRGDDRIWFDGPGQINVGIAIDTEVSVRQSDSDGDGYSDFEEFLVGTNPNDPSDTPLTHPTTREEAIAQDTDHDTYPDFIERALSTDPNDPNSYPAGFVKGPTFDLPVVGQVQAGQVTHGLVADQPEDQDKIIDLRLPLQDAGSIDFACVGPNSTNYTGTGGSLLTTPLNQITIFNPASTVNPAASPIPVVPTTAQPFVAGLPRSSPDYANQTPQGPCVMVGYQTSSPGHGQATVPHVTGVENGDPGGANDANGGPAARNVTFDIPAGILAVGDAVTTKYDVDYFFVVDLGGDDVFNDRAGGALLVTSTPTSSASTRGATSSALDSVSNDTFFAPSLVVNVDLAAVGDHGSVTAAGETARIDSNGSWGSDSYVGPTKESNDLTQGSLESVLIDTYGDDSYSAGSGSQGALGGVLLDLQGSDIYRAGNLSQGAALLTPSPGKDAPGVPHGDTPNDYTSDPAGGTVESDQQTNARNTPPSLLLDLGAGNDWYRAGWNSQGFARGLSDASGNGRGAVGAGILLDDGGDDWYDTASAHGPNSQGVGAQGGLGVLLDLAGNDTYTAYGVQSQGAPLSTTFGVATPPPNAAGAGILIDAGGRDQYRYYDIFGEHDRTATRQDNLTITRNDIASPDFGNGAGHLYGAPGIHWDTEATDPSVAVSSLVGNGDQPIANTDPLTSGDTSLQGFYVKLPTARLAIGDGTPTTYTDPYAFVVDLGGANHYEMNAGGFVPEILGRSDAVALPTAASYHPLLSLYPVSLLVDAGQTPGADGSNYTSSASFSQGAGYFSVGVLADLAGNDTFTVLPQPVQSYASGWMPNMPTLDGNLARHEWDNARVLDVQLTDQNDPRYVEPATLRIANDDHNIYVAISGQTSSDGPTRDTSNDIIVVDLLADRDALKPYDTPHGQTLLDESQVKIGRYQCDGSVDRFFDPTNGTNGAISTDLQNDVRYGCIVNADGTFTIELVKPLRATLQRDPDDLNIPFTDARGYNPSDLGVRVELQEHQVGGTNVYEHFAWPAGTVNVDGANGYRPDGDLHDELADWAVLGLASLGHDGAAPSVTKTPSFAQGAGLAGVGILAALGQSSADGSNYTASDHAQGYGGFGGFGLLLDAGGSDRYVAGSRSQGAAEAGSMGMLVELDGNDQYKNEGKSLGYVAPGDNAAALFADVGGFDTYRTGTPGARDLNNVNETVTPGSGSNERDARNASPTATPLGDVVTWSSGGGNGVGIDAFSNPILTTIERSTTTTLKIMQPDANGACSDSLQRPVPLTAFASASLPVASGLVCLQADARVALDKVGLASPPDLAIESVSFLIDGREYAVNASSVNGARFMEPLDVSGLPDGVKSIFAQATVRVVLPNGVTAKVTSEGPDASNHPESIQRLVVNDPAHAAVCTLPKLDVPTELASDPCAASDVPAVFSPDAIDGPNNLSVVWAASHDAFEDGHELTQGWRVPADRKNVPCPDAKVGLCNVIPLYLQTDGGAIGAGSSTWDTTPGDLASTNPETVYPQLQATEYVRKSAKLNADLDVVQNDGFHVKLFDHQALLFPGTYTTNINVTLVGPDGLPVRDINGSILRLASQDFASSQNPINLQDPTATQVTQAGGVADVLRSAFKAVSSALTDPNGAGPAVNLVDRTIQGAPVGSSWGTVYATACSALTIVCPELSGDISTIVGGPDGGVHVCDKAPTLPGCSPSVDQAVRAVAGSVDGPLSGESIEDTARGLASSGGATQLNWTDFYVTLNFNASAVPPSVPLRIHDGVVTIPANYSFNFEMTLYGPSSSPFVTVASLGPIVAGALWPVTNTLNTTTVGLFTDDGPTGAGCKAQEAVCTFTHDVLAQTVWGQMRLSEQGANQTVIPVPVATFHMFDPQDPSVFEIRTPASPHTRTTVDIATMNADGSAGDPVATITNGVIAGDVAGSPTRTIQVCDPETLQNCHLDYDVNASSNDVEPMNATCASEPHPTYLRYTQHVCLFNGAVLPDGAYLARIAAADDSNHELAQSQQPFLLDATPPKTFLDLGRGYVGAALLSGGSSVPVSWQSIESGSGLKRVAVWGHTGSARMNDPSKWFPLGCGVADAQGALSCPLAPTVTHADYTQRETRITDYYFITVGEDAAGNVEFQDRIVDPATQGAYAGNDVMYKAFLAKLHDGVTGDATNGFQAVPGIVDTLIVDSVRPEAVGTPDVSGTHTASYGGVDTQFVKAGAPFTATVCAADTGTQVDTVRIVFDYVDAATGNVTSWNATASTGPASLCPLGGTAYQYAGWGDVNGNSRTVTDGAITAGGSTFTSAAARFNASDLNKPLLGEGIPSGTTIASIVNATTVTMTRAATANATNASVLVGFPDGAWAVSADIFDLAGNREQVSIANVILDSKPPTATLLDPIYPSGQEAVRPGDIVSSRVTLRLNASDEFGVDASAITVDASALNQSGVLARCAPGKTEGCLREVRVNGHRYQEVSLRADVAGLKDGLYALPVTVPDNAGNLWTGAFHVLVDSKRFDIVPGSLSATNASYDGFVIHWQTTENTTSQVTFGTSPFELKGKTSVNTTLVKQHDITVTGLSASTRYYFQVVSATAGGYVNKSDVLDALTTTALFLTPESPARGDAVSGAVPVRFSGGLRASTDPVKFTLDVQPASGQPWSFVTTLTESGEDHELTFNSTRFLDGDAYRLRITANTTDGKDGTSVVLGPFLSDNTAPELQVLAPLVATNDTTPQLVAEARDNLAGFDRASAAQLTLDGATVSGLALESGNESLRITYDVPTALAAGYHTFALSVTDRAGNVASETWKVAVDGTPPVVTPAPLRFAPGPSAAKLGGSVTVNVTASDASGVQSITLDTSGIADKPTTDLAHVTGTNYWVGTFTVSARDLEKTIHVPLTATDVAGNARALTLDVPVDNAPPIVGNARTSDIAQTHATLSADSNEPIRVTIVATSPGMDPVTVSSVTLDAHPTLRLDGLFPSRAYAYQLQAFDRAGNEVDLSGSFQTSLDLKPPTQVGALSVLDLLNGTLRLSWPPAHDDVAVAFYRIYRAADNDSMRPIAEVKGLTYDDTNLPLEKAFTYQVAAVDYGGNEGVASGALRASATAVPHLSGGIVSPTVGGTATVFRYVVTYTSPGGVKPTYVHVLIDGAAQDMRAVGDGTYVFETRLAPHTRDHPHTYSFEASDGRYTVRFPDDGSTLRGPLVSGDALADAASGVVGFAQRVPMLGIVGTASALTVAAAAVLILRRRGSK